MYLKIGLEKEMFLLDENKAVLEIPSHLPQDDCGYLLEARGEPSTNIEQAVFSLMAEEYKIRENVQKEFPTYETTDEPYKKVSKDFLMQIMRTHIKGKIKYQNIYEFKRHKTAQNEVPSGIHISFTCPKERSITYLPKSNSTTLETQAYNAMFDWLQIFKKLDEAFKDEIKAAKRLPGFYELKEDGRIEYRSLPSNTDLKKIIKVLKEILTNKN
jgi:hypothetical protein